MKIGDIFFAKIDDDSKKYFQFVANDITQLNSDVIRIFKKKYSITDHPNVSEVVSDEVQFYAHCVIKWGVKLGFWEKIGNSHMIGETSIVFRDCGDDPSIKISHDWWVWRTNHDRKKVGELKGENRKAEIGDVVPADSIIYRMRTGNYDFEYPAFEK